MLRFERLRVDPTAEELASLLAEAAARANEAERGGLLAWPPAGLAAELAATAGERAGHRQWAYAGAASPHRGCSGVGLAWWADHLGRRHHRVVGARGAFGADRPQAVLAAQG